MKGMMGSVGTVSVPSSDIVIFSAIHPAYRAHIDLPPAQGLAGGPSEIQRTLGAHPALRW